MRLPGIILITYFLVIKQIHSYSLRALATEKPTGCIYSRSPLRIDAMSHNSVDNLSEERDTSKSTPPEQSIEGLSKVKAVRYFINLTNGIEIIPALLKQGVPMEHINYFRLQSTHCEMRNYEGIIENLDYNLLMSLALGYVCIVYDYGSRGNAMTDEREGIPRAFWWGTEWIRYVLDHFWHLEDEGQEVRMVRGYNSRKVFEDQVKLLPKDLKRRLKYFRVFLQTNRIHLYPLYSKTERDGEREYYSSLLVESITRESSDLTKLQNMSREEVDGFVESQILSEGMHIYRSRDFEGFGRALGYGEVKAVEAAAAVSTEGIKSSTVEDSVDCPAD